MSSDTLVEEQRQRVLDARDRRLEARLPQRAHTRRLGLQGSVPVGKKPSVERGRGAAQFRPRGIDPGIPPIAENPREEPGEGRGHRPSFGVGISDKLEVVCRKL